MCTEQLLPIRQMAAAIPGCISFDAVRCSSASVPSAALSPIFPNAVAASSCSGPSIFAISISFGTAAAIL